jgi:hypothetical protein
MMMRLGMVSALLFTLIPSAPCQTGLGLSPMRVEIASRPGAVHSGALDLTTDSPAAVRFRGELLDFHIDEMMTPQFSRNMPSEAEHSCRGWLTVNPMESEVGPGQHIIARYTIRVPQDAAPKSYYCAAGFTAVPPADQLLQSGLRTTVRVVAVFYVVVGDPPVQGGLEELGLERVPGSNPAQWRAVLTLRNAGDRHFRPQGLLQVLGCSGEVLEEISLPSFPALPRRNQRYLMPLQTAIPEQICSIKAAVELGNHEILATQARVALPREAR